MKQMKEMQGGVFLCTAEEMIGDQATWSAECVKCENSLHYCDVDIKGHECGAYWKDFDFNICKFWVTTDCGLVEPSGFETEAEAYASIE